MNHASLFQRDVAVVVDPLCCNTNCRKCIFITSLTHKYNTALSPPPADADSAAAADSFHQGLVLDLKLTIKIIISINFF